MILPMSQEKSALLNAVDLNLTFTTVYGIPHTRCSTPVLKTINSVLKYTQWKSKCMVLALIFYRDLSTAHSL